MSNRNVLIMGDFNYAEIDWSRHTVSTSALSGCCEFFRVVEDCFYTQHVLSPTRGGATLDLVFTNEPDLVSDVTAIQNLGSSDHNMVAFTAHLYCNQFYSKRSLRDYNKGDYDAINSALTQVEWDGLLNGNTLVCWQRFLELLLNLEDKHVKNGDCQSRNRKPVWMSHKALRSVRRKRKDFRKYKDINHPAVKSACRVARVELRKSRRNFEEKLALNIKNDSNPVNHEYGPLNLPARHYLLAHCGLPALGQ